MAVAALVIAACGSPDAKPTQISTISPAQVIDSTEQSTTIRVIYITEGFTPDTVEIQQAEAIEFVNTSQELLWPASNIHPTHAIYPEFDPGRPISPGESWRFVFDRVGQWRYHNHLRPHQRGLVVVKGETTPPEVTSISDEHKGEVTFKPLGSVLPREIALLLEDDEALIHFMKEYGPGAAVKALSDQETHLGVDCHQRAHVLGRLAYEEFGPRAFSLMGHECHSGGYHGATEAFFHVYGTFDLQTNISLICSNTVNSFFRHQCVHGIGHGIMAWTSYQLLDALGACDMLNAAHDGASCYSGVFMENVVGGLSGSMGHVTEYLSDDPHYPCNILEPKYLGACYFYQTSRMIQLFGGDFQKVAEACDAIPQSIQYLCFESMGRDVGGASRGDPQQAIGHCSKVIEEQDRRHCLSGAVQDWFWDAGGADNALNFCKALDEEEDKRICYTVIIQRARELSLDPTDFEQFCAQIEEGYRQICY